MNNKEKALASYLLRLADNTFSNFGCNDVSEEVWENWSTVERQEFVREYHEHNGDIEEYDPEFLHIPDFALMGFLAHKLTQDI